MSRSQALKLMRHAANLRSNLALMDRSPRVERPHVDAARSKSVLYLAREFLIYPPEMAAAGLVPDMTYAERKSVLDLPDPRPLTPPESSFVEFLATEQRKARKSTWIWRIGQQAQEMANAGWYGFFVTLTVDPSRCADSQALWEENREFRIYIRKLARVASKASGHFGAIKKGVSVSKFVKHVGVIEHGKSRHHHHMHLLLWMRDIPSEWKVCPNKGIRNPEDRIHDWCRPLTTYWPHALPGLGRAKYFRHEGDIWSHLGFSLPWDAKKKRTIRIASPLKAGVYVGKYMDKDDKVWLHRVKATRGLGLGLLRQTLMDMAIQKVEALTWRPRSFDLNATVPTIHNVPSVLVRSLAKQELFYRKWASRTLDYQTLVLPSTAPYNAMLKSVRDGLLPQRMSSEELFDWLTELLPVPDGYSEDAYYRACHELGIDFPPDRSLPITHIGVT